MRARTFIRLAYLLPSLFTGACAGIPALGALCLPADTEVPYLLVAGALCFVMKSRPIRAQLILLGLQPLVSLPFVWTFLSDHLEHPDPASAMVSALLAGYAHAAVWGGMFALGVQAGVWPEFRREDDDVADEVEPSSGDNADLDR